MHYLYNTNVSIFPSFPNLIYQKEIILKKKSYCISNCLEAPTELSCGLIPRNHHLPHRLKSKIMHSTIESICLFVYRLQSVIREPKAGTEPGGRN